MVLKVMFTLFQDAADKREALMNRKVMRKLEKLEQTRASERTSWQYMYTHSHKTCTGVILSTVIISLLLLPPKQKKKKTFTTLCSFMKLSKYPRLKPSKCGDQFTVPNFCDHRSHCHTKCCADSMKYKELNLPVDSNVELTSILSNDQHTWIAAASLLSSCTTLARASGLTPASSSCTHILNVSSSSPVFSKSEISFTAAKTKTL